MLTEHRGDDDLLAALLAGPGYFTCGRLQTARISFRQCQINFQTARDRLESADWLVGPLRPCLECSEGEGRMALAPEDLELPPPCRSFHQVQRDSPIGKVIDAKAMAKNQIPPAPPLKNYRPEACATRKKRPKPPAGMTPAVARSLGLI